MLFGCMVKALTMPHQIFVPNFFRACNRAARQISKLAMKHFFSAAFVLTSVTISAISPARAQEANPILLELRPQLQAAMQKVAPDATWELKGNELTASYKTQVSTVHSLRFYGDFAAQSHEEVGPTDSGFILRVRVFSDFPSFAQETPREERQERWKTFLARFNLRAGDATNFVAPEPEILQTEREGRSGDRIQMGAASPALQAKFTNLQDAGLIDLSDARNLYDFRGARYKISAQLAFLQEMIPDLTKNKARRIAALQAATATAGHKFSPVQIEALDGDLRDLQTEFYGSLQRLSSRGSFLELRDPEIKKLIEKAKKPAYLVFTLQTPLNDETLSPQPFTQIIEDAVRANNGRADEK